MNKFNFEGITPQTIGRLIIMLIALANMILTMGNHNPVNVDNNLIYDTVSILFVLGTTLYSSYKNMNVTTASQKLQTVLDMVNQGELLVDDIDEIVEQVKVSKIDKKK